MYRNIVQQIRDFGAEYNIVPKTWILPQDYKLFQKEREESEGKHKFWIIKPANSSCGRGIKLLSHHSRVPKQGAYVINTYLMHPHLIRGFKYDLRVYVLVTSFDPLTVYVYQDGLVRFATQPYQTKNRKQRFCHLTNFSINKNAQNYKKASGADEGEEENSSKWTIKQLATAFNSMGIEFDPIWAKVKDLIIKTVISVEPILANNLSRAANGRRLCFEVFGFDVIFDRDLKPWLLEVNVLPSLSSSSELDKKIKTALMSDTFNLIGVVPYKKKQYDKETELRNWERFTGLTRKAGETDAASNK